MLVKRILFPTDFSEGALSALPYAVDLAKNCGAKLYMLHVVYDIATASGLYVPHVSVDEMYKELEAGAKKELENFGLEERRGVKDVEYSVLRGTPYEEILKFARENNVDMIVLGTHGRKGLDRFLFGSTAEKVVRYAACPVLTVRGTQKQ
ncbi:MAG: universal stress protein [Nitrospirae bacterium]|nr:universal stress protein [Nitrospirota bacterium]